MILWLITLKAISKIPLLTPSEEIELAHHVQAMKELLDVQDADRTLKQLQRIRIGKRAHDRMMAANIRLVVSIEKTIKIMALIY